MFKKKHHLITTKDFKQKILWFFIAVAISFAYFMILAHSNHITANIANFFGFRRYPNKVFLGFSLILPIMMAIDYFFNKRKILKKLPLWFYLGVFSNLFFLMFIRWLGFSMFRDAFYYTVCKFLGFTHLMSLVGLDYNYNFGVVGVFLIFMFGDFLINKMILFKTKITVILVLLLIWVPIIILHSHLV